MRRLVTSAYNASPPVFEVTFHKSLHCFLDQ